MAFDIAAARKAGYTETEIADYLASQSKFDAKAARDAGYTDAEIAAHLSTPQKKAAAPKAPVADVDLTTDYMPGRKAMRREGPSISPDFAALGRDAPRRVGYRAPRTSSQKAKDDAHMAARLEAKYKSDEAGVALRGLGSAAGPTLGGVSGAAAGAALAAPSAVLTGPVGPFLGSVVGGLGGAYAGYRAQKSVIDMLPDEVVSALGQSDVQQAQDAKAHPYIKFAAENVPGFLMGRPSASVGETFAGGILGGGLEAGREAVLDGEIDPGKVALATMFGGTQAKGTRLARALVGPTDNGIQSEIRKIRPPPGEGRNRQADVLHLGERPTPVDVLPESIVGALGSDARSGSPNATTLFRKYADDVVEKTPVVARRRTERIAPTDKRTGAEAKAAADEQIATAQDSVRPDVPIGETSTAMAERLLAQREAERKGGDRLFEEARSKGVATLERAHPPELGEDAGWAQMTPEQMDEFNAHEGDWINVKTGETKSAVDMADLKTTQKPGPEIAANLRDSISAYALRPSEIEGTTRLLSDFDKLSSVDTSNLYGLRESLGNLERAYAGTADAAAAATARRKLDDLIATYDEQGRFTGDPDVVKANRAAIDYWRQFRQKFDDSTLIGKLSGMEWRGNSRQPVSDPQTAGRLILGALSEGGDRVRNLQELRDHFGADSPEWQGLRQEAIEKLVGPDRNNVKKLAEWQRANPKLAEMLLGQEGAANLGAAQGDIEAAQGRQAAMKTGGDFTSADPQDFAASVAGMDRAAKRDAIVALRQRMRDALGTPQSSVGLLSEVATNPKAKENMLALLPAEEARGFIRDATTLITRLKTSKAPLGGAVADEGEGLLTDVARAAGTVAGGPKGRVVANVLMDLLKGKGTPAKRRAEAERLAADLLDPAKTDATLEFVDKMYGQNAVQRVLDTMREKAAKTLDTSVKIGRLPGAYVAGQDSDGSDPPKPVVAGPSSPQTEEELLKSMTEEELDARIAEGEKGYSAGVLSGSNNNPGGLKDFPWTRKQPGYAGPAGEFAKFETPEAGAAAHKRLLTDRYLSRGFDTPAKLIARYDSDPRTTPEQRRNYTRYVAKRLGIGISDRIPMDRVDDLQQAQAEWETGHQVGG